MCCIILNGVAFLLPTVNECEVDNGGCEQLCVDLPKSFFCDCRPGYTLASNGRNCSGK